MDNGDLLDDTSYKSELSTLQSGSGEYWWSGHHCGVVIRQRSSVSVDSTESKVCRGVSPSCIYVVATGPSQ